jgi:hypothetical protein
MRKIKIPMLNILNSGLFRISGFEIKKSFLISENPASNIRQIISFFENIFSAVTLKRTLQVIIYTFCFSAAYPRDAGTLVLQYKDSLNNLAHVMQRGDNDSARFAAASVYYSILNFILSDSSSFNASFDSIPNLSVKTSPDKTFRLYTWVTSSYSGSVYRYSGLVQTQKNKKVNLFPLADSTDAIEKPLSTKLKATRWLGAIYYNIIVNERKGKKFYTLLGWKGKNEMLTQKVIDVITFDSGKPAFGLPVFKSNNIYNHRVLFEFTSQAVLSLKYVSEKKTIVFDHIGRSTVTGIIGPDGTYDAFKYTQDHWEFLPDVDVDNGFIPKKKEVKLFKDDELKR